MSTTIERTRILFGKLRLGTKIDRLKTGEERTYEEPGSDGYRYVRVLDSEILGTYVGIDGFPGAMVPAGESLLTGYKRRIGRTELKVTAGK